MLLPVVKDCLVSFLLFFTCFGGEMKSCLLHLRILFYSFPHLEGLSMYSRLIK